MTNVGTLLRTVRHLRGSQLLWRLRALAKRHRKTTPRTANRWRWKGEGPPIPRPDFPSIPLGRCKDYLGSESVPRLAQGVFHHLNQGRALGHASPDWRLGPVREDRLWTITLHYHEWAYDLALVAAAGGPRAGEARDLFKHYVSDWITRCSLETAGSRDLAWNPFAAATRISWWIRCYRVLGASRFRAWGPFEADFLGSLWQQAAYLHDHLEWDLRANHLLRDAVGLAWAGRFFAGGEAQRWMATATRLAREQAAEQVLPDGGHFERSPLYHLQAMEDFRALALLVEDSAVQTELRAVWWRMAECAAWLRHPDGQISLFNDAALGADYDPAGLAEWGESLGLPADPAPRRGGRHFADLGMAVWHGIPWTLFFDAGPPGADCQPGHAHADTLSVEASYLGRRLFVDPGTYGYDDDEHRRYDRSTASHNTVSVDGRDSSEVWQIFRVGRRARPLGVHVACSGGSFDAVASHDGYDHLPGRPRHTRRVAIGPDRGLSIRDRIDGKGRHRVEGGYLLAPEWTPIRRNGGWLVENGQQVVRIRVRGPEGLTLSEDRRPYHSGYGQEEQTIRLTWRADRGLPVEVEITVEGA